MRRRLPAELRVTCPGCGGQASQVLETRGRLTVDGVYRRRLCGECGHRFSTRETLAHATGSVSGLDESRDTAAQGVD